MAGTCPTIPCISRLESSKNSNTFSTVPQWANYEALVITLYAIDYVQQAEEMR